MNIKLDFTTDYHQFYICDKEHSGTTDSDSFWTDEAFSEKLAFEDGILGVQIANDNGHVKCNLIFLNVPNQAANFDNYDYVVEASLEINSGYLQVRDCPFSEIQEEFNVEKGFYRVRVYAMNQKSVIDNYPTDEYVIEIWKDKNDIRRVLKSYNI